MEISDLRLDNAVHVAFELARSGVIDLCPPLDEFEIVRLKASESEMPGEIRYNLRRAR